MKKHFILFLIIGMLSSCVTRIYTIQETSIDYTKYTQQGFFMSEASSVTFEYEPISSVSAIIFSGNKPGWADEKKKLNIQDNYSGDWKKAEYADALDVIYNEAIKNGADGIINLTFKVGYTNEGFVEYVEVKGMAIKRNKDALHFLYKT